MQDALRHLLTDRQRMTTDALCESYISTGALLLKAAFFGLTDRGRVQAGVPTGRSAFT